MVDWDGIAQLYVLQFQIIPFFDIAVRDPVVSVGISNYGTGDVGVGIVRGPKIQEVRMVVGILPHHQVLIGRIEYLIARNALKEQGKIEVFVLAVEIEPIADLGNGNPLKSTVVIGYETVPVHIPEANVDRKSTRLNSSHVKRSYAVF